MGLSLLLLALVLFGASQGALKISFDALFDEEYRDIWLNIRLPRVLLAVLVGAALATAGVIMQGLFRNPMADPGLLGVSSGSALMVGVAIVLPFSFPVVLVLYEQMVFAIAGSFSGLHHHFSHHAAPSRWQHDAIITRRYRHQCPVRRSDRHPELYRR